MGMTPLMAPFGAVPMLFMVVADSDLLLFLREAHGLLAGCPALIERIEADLDAHGCGKKALRVADAAWQADRTASLPGHASEPTVIDPARLTLSQGRPRTPAYVVLIAVLLRGYFGAGFKACDADTMMQESITLRVFFTMTLELAPIADRLDTAELEIVWQESELLDRAQSTLTVEIDGQPRRTVRERGHDGRLRRVPQGRVQLGVVDLRLRVSPPQAPRTQDVVRSAAPGVAPRARRRRR